MHVAHALLSVNEATILRKCALKVIRCGLLFGLLGSAAAQAYLPIRNQSPFTLLVGIPAMSDAHVVKNNQQRYQLLSTVSNNWYIKGRPGDNPYVDGETLNTEARFEFGFEPLALIIDIPYLYHNGGFLDGFIEEYHKFFGLPNGNRQDYPQDRLDFRYRGIDEVRLDRDVNGFSDIRISTAFQLAQSATSAHAITAQLKLSNGSSDKWLGSGGINLGAYMTHHWQYWIMTTDLQYGLLWQQNSTFLPNQTQHWVGFLSLAFDIQIAGGWYAVAQYDGNSAAWTHSSQPPLTDGHVGTLGIRWKGREWQVHGAVLEDLKVGSAPDVGFQLGFRFAPFN